ncbi:MAG: efflux RND transporter permease subunit, partial [Deltaproteobacteria bacterium]|nr:efflux RND transporter permease subunit [Deltaproteobacteria bacterium]
MSMTGVFIRRPVATTILMAAMLVFGVMGYFELPVSNLPNVDFPTIEVSANLSGANPETMASAVATPLEKQVSTIAGLSSMTSTSALGVTSVVLQFDLDRDIDAAAQDVQTAIGKAVRFLPSDMTMPNYQKVNPADSPIILYTLTSPTLPLSELDAFGQNVLAQNLSMVSGVAQVQVFGSQKYAVRIQLDPGTLAARGIDIAQVAQAVRDANVNMPTGTLWGPDRAVSVETNAQLRDAAGFRSVIVDYRDGSLVRLGDLGRVIDDVQDNRSAAWSRDSRAVILAVRRQPGSNTVQVADQVRARVEELSSRLPGSVKIDVLFDRSAPIRESVHDVKFTLALTLVLVVLVIFLFLRNVSATLIPSLALPISLVATFGVMSVFGYTLDNLSRMALTLALG